MLFSEGNASLQKGSLPRHRFWPRVSEAIWSGHGVSILLTRLVMVKEPLQADCKSSRGHVCGCGLALALQRLTSQSCMMSTTPQAPREVMAASLVSWRISSASLTHRRGRCRHPLDNVGSQVSLPLSPFLGWQRRLNFPFLCSLQPLLDGHTNNA